MTSFQALLAPFLVDSLELERQVLESPLADSDARGRRAGEVVGIALLAGPLRRPFGISHPLIGPTDYRGATIGIRPAALPARRCGPGSEGYVPGVLSGLDGAEIDPEAIDYNSWEGALTINVVLWPKPYTIFMNRDAFDALTSEQQEILREAGREALAPELARSHGTKRLPRRAYAERSRSFPLRLPTSQRCAKRYSPSTQELESDPDTRAATRRDRGAEREPAPTVRAAPDCRRARREAAGGPALEGRWKLNWTRAALIAEGIVRRDALPQKGWVVYEFAGRFRFRTIIPGAASRGGDILGRGRCPEPGLRRTGTGYIAGHVHRHRWSIYRDTLTFSRFPDSDARLVLLVNPLTRVR